MLRWIGRLTVGFWIGVAAIAAPVIGYAAYLQATGNIHEVSPDLYRSGTLSTEKLRALIEETGIKTVVNLRSGEGSDWLSAERGVLQDLHVDFIGLPLSATQIPSEEELRSLAYAMMEAPRPILVHCKAGADRSGLASAIYRYVVEGLDRDEAEAQLSFRYGHFPWFGSETRAMGLAFERFADDWQRHTERRRREETHPFEQPTSPHEDRDPAIVLASQ
ncbi:MAG: tyrosine-protein phosphatase [Fulvimarina manganoxydans]|uniref:fused DSP-PTPase phosphatase/NAD kinase-like protein n=1 Tax=Fulvimarina manganoxydans TaxID=937218 RepID=UPI00235659E4|nr:tyrosine-protein phosphatase [Fulvimarina manganoxydans]MCK5931551.1 tyrosine-protein phosphatase [Fulvimarina manganoxydans]